MMVDRPCAAAQVIDRSHVADDVIGSPPQVRRVGLTAHSGPDVFGSDRVSGNYTFDTHFFGSIDEQDGVESAVSTGFVEQSGLLNENRDSFPFRLPAYSIERFEDARMNDLIQTVQEGGLGEYAASDPGPVEGPVAGIGTRSEQFDQGDASRRVVDQNHAADFVGVE